METYEDTIGFLHLSLSLHLCHAHIISVGWSSSLKKEGKKSQEHCGLADDFGFSTSPCKCQVIHKWFSKCCLCWNQIKVSSRRHMKPEPVLGLQGFWWMRGPVLSPRELPPFHKIPAKAGLCCSSLRWVLLSTRDVPIQALPHRPLPCARADYAQRWGPAPCTKRPKRSLTSCVTLCVSAWLHTAFTSWETALVQSGLSAEHYKIEWIKFPLYLGLLGEPHTWCTKPQIRKLNNCGVLEIFCPW